MKKDFFNFQKLWLLTSFPTWVLGLGYLIFYSQTVLGWWHFSKEGSAWVLAFLCFLTYALGFYCAYHATRITLSETLREETSFVNKFGIAAVLALIALGLLSSLKPTHLIQESDFVNYHLMLVKQHWLAGNWRPVEWSAFEFRSLLQQYGFSYLWVGLPLLNKLPQFFIFYFLVLRIWSFFWLFQFRFPQIQLPWSRGLAAALCFLAFRNTGIQIGMAMLDMASLFYLLSIFVFASFIYFSDRRILGQQAPLFFVLLGLDLCGYLGYKSFSFIYLGSFLIVAAILAHFLLARFSITDFLTKIKWQYVALPLLFIWVPNLARSFYYTGDPFYPVLSFATKHFCVSERLSRTSCHDLILLGDRLKELINSFGYGHHLEGFLKSLYVVALTIDGPTRVNNIFDYPLGLFWFFTWAVLLMGLFHPRLKELRKAAIFCFSICALFYVTWFMGSQQSRWLYPVTLTLCFFWALARGSQSLLTLPRGHRIVQALVLLSVLGAAVSGARIVRSQRHTLECLGYECLKTGKTYAEDYDQRCDRKEELVLDRIKDRGYLNCRFSPKEWNYEF